jgi:hypothetical protein
LIQLAFAEDYAKVRDEAKSSVQYQTTLDAARVRIEKLPQDEQDKEYKRLKDKEKVEMAAAKKQWAVERKKAKEQAKAAANDGLDDASDAQADRVAQAGPDDADAADGDGIDGDGTAAAPANGAPAANVTAVANSAAPTANAPSASSSSGSASSSSSKHHDTSASSVAIGVGFILALIIFGFGIKPIFFLIGALLLAYRTAAGAAWG